MKIYTDILRPLKYQVAQPLPTVQLSQHLDSVAIPAATQTQAQLYDAPLMSGILRYMTRAFLLCGTHPKTHNPSLILRELKTYLAWRYSTE